MPLSAPPLAAAQIYYRCKLDPEQGRQLAEAYERSAVAEASEEPAEVAEVDAATERLGDIHESCDMLTAAAEYEYNHDHFRRCYKLSKRVLAKDPFQQHVLPVRCRRTQPPPSAFQASRRTAEPAGPRPRPVPSPTPPRPEAIATSMRTNLPNRAPTEGQLRVGAPDAFKTLSSNRDARTCHTHHCYTRRARCSPYPLTWLAATLHFSPPANQPCPRR